MIEEIKLKFCQRFEMTDEGEMEHFLNVRVTRTREFLTMDQTVYAQGIVDKHIHLLAGQRIPQVTHAVGRCGPTANS